MICVNKSDLKLDWASHKAALYACKHWHYSRSVPSGKLLKFGVYENDRFIGVVLFSRGANKNIVNPFKIKQTEGCELTRVALDRHSSQVSKIVSIAIKLFKKKFADMKLIISYADPNQGHLGGIYQAGNWVYTGLGNNCKVYLLNGKEIHSKTIYSKFGTNKLSLLKKIDNFSIMRTGGKHRYLMPLTKEMRERVLPLAKPYPKACKAGDDSDQGNSDGATPICTLQKDV